MEGPRRGGWCSSWSAPGSRWEVAAELRNNPQQTLHNLASVSIHTWNTCNPQPSHIAGYSHPITANSLALYFRSIPCSGSGQRHGHVGGGESRAVHSCLSEREAQALKTVLIGVREPLAIDIPGHVSLCCAHIFLSPSLRPGLRLRVAQYR